MLCPECSNDLRVTSNKLVKREDGSIARRIRLSCLNHDCKNHNKIVETIYHPQDIEDDTPE